MHVEVDCAGVLEVGGDLLLLPAGSVGVRLLLHGVVPGLWEGNNRFESCVVGTLLKSMAARTVWDTVRY